MHTSQKMQDIMNKTSFRDDDNIVEQYRQQNPWRSDIIREDLRQNPTRRSNLITLSHHSVQWKSF